MCKSLLAYLFESSVPIIQVEIVLFMKIITDQQVRPAVIINITDSNTQTKIVTTSKNACFTAYIFKVAIVITIKPVSILRVTERSQTMCIKKRGIKFIGMI